VDNARELTKGEYLVGITFNPGGHPAVNDIKRKAADFIDAVEALRNGEEAASKAQVDQVARLKSLAITHIEDAAMWAVKAATKPA
jgi:hypothetical protein